jgi:hypothetical protein
MRQLKLSLLILTTILAVSSPTHAQDQQSTAQNSGSNSTTDLIGVGASILNSLINPPSRSAEINADAEVRKAKIAAEADIVKEKLRIEASKNTDRVTPILNQWGVSRVACGPGLVFVNGITTDTVCIQPSNSMAAGYYTYDSAKQQLVRNNSQPSNSGQSSNSGQASNSGQSNNNDRPNNTDRNNTDAQTIQNTQTTRISNPSRSFKNQGF